MLKLLCIRKCYVAIKQRSPPKSPQIQWRSTIVLSDTSAIDDGSVSAALYDGRNSYILNEDWKATHQQTSR